MTLEISARYAFSFGCTSSFGKSSGSFGSDNLLSNRMYITNGHFFSILLDFRWMLKTFNPLKGPF